MRAAQAADSQPQQDAAWQPGSWARTLRNVLGMGEPTILDPVAIYADASVHGISALNRLRRPTFCSCHLATPAACFSHAGHHAIHELLPSSSLHIVDINQYCAYTPSTRPTAIFRLRTLLTHHPRWPLSITRGSALCLRPAPTSSRASNKPQVR